MINEKALKEIRKNAEKINARNDAADSKAAKRHHRKANRFIGSLPAVDTSKDGCENLPTGLEEK